MLSEQILPALFAELLLAETGFSDIREIVPEPNYWPWVATGALVLLGALIIWWRRRKSQTPPRPKPGESPHAKALRLLRDLQERGARLGAEAFTVEVSGILRVYLEEALDVPAPEQTSDEFLQDLRGQTWLTGEMKADLEEFMRLADLVKFARQSLSDDQRQRLLDNALQVIDATQPQPETSASA